MRSMMAAAVVVAMVLGGCRDGGDASGERYFATQQAGTLDALRAYCEAGGGRLATPRTLDELEAALEACQRDAPSAEWGYCWTGSTAERTWTTWGDPLFVAVTWSGGTADFRLVPASYSSGFRAVCERHADPYGTDVQP